MSEYRLTDQKYSEAEYLFQTIEMAKSDEEFDVELCSTPPAAAAHRTEEMELMRVSDPQFRGFVEAWKLVTRRRPRRRYTVSHSSGGGGGGSSSCQNGGGGGSNGSTGGGGGGSGLPPAPPSTPTSLTPTNTSLLSSASNEGGGGGGSVVGDDADHQLNNLLYILDYAPKYKKKLKEQQRTDAELAELFNVVSITAATNGTSASATSKMKVQPERGVSSMSRTIQKPPAATTKIFKIRRNLREFFRETDEEDSVSAPEYDTEEEDTRYQRLRRIQRKRQRRFARFEHQERMEHMVDIFDEAMNFNET